uniref:Uncharacterized protein n=1 Tax=Romanomermis culicivorax TaxID=13658 RepID=A0A915JFJ4_ROMCU
MTTAMNTSGLSNAAPPCFGGVKIGRRQSFHCLPLSCVSCVKARFEAYNEYLLNMLGIVRSAMSTYYILKLLHYCKVECIHTSYQLYEDD